MNNKIINYLNFFLNKTGFQIDQIETPLPVETQLEDKKLIQKIKPNSMSSNIRLIELINSINYLIRNNIEGDFVECGVWKGANLVLMQKLIERNKLNSTRVYGFDTFDGMSEPTEFDFDLLGNSAKDLMSNTIKKEGRGIWAYSSLQTVENNIQNSVNFPDNINLIKGKVETTLLDDSNLPDRISLLRLDTDFYESTKIELEVLFPKLEKGGVLIIDDYGHFKGARKAVDEYFGDRKIWLKYVDYTCRLYVKE